MVFLPEACDYIAETVEDSIHNAESIHGPLVSKYQMLAVSERVWLSVGGLHIKVIFFFHFLNSIYLQVKRLEAKSRQTNLDGLCILLRVLIIARKFARNFAFFSVL